MLRENVLLRELFNHANESIIVINAMGEIHLLNPATERLFGYEQEALKGKKIEVLLPEDIAPKHHIYRDNYNKNPHARKMGIGLDLYARKKDGTQFPVEISLSPFALEDTKYVIAFIIDITKRKVVEQEIILHQKKLELLTSQLKSINEKLETKVLDRTKVLQEALHEIEKSRTELSEALDKEKELNELKSRFLSMASHEFRTPLTTILSSATLIGDYKQNEHQDKREKHVERIKAAVNNLNDILTDFLSLSKIEEGKVVAHFKWFDMKNLVHEVIDDMKTICKKGQQISYTHIGEDVVMLDPKLLRNVLINLTSNAIKFSDENKTILLRSVQNEHYLNLEVEDHGMGISDEDKEHLFQRFFRGQNASNIQGTGLGLNIVARYIELMHGTINIESQLEKGTTIKLNFKQNKEQKNG